MTAQGWYVDPFEVHEARWFSDGRPTPLVRDAGDESQDPPPAAAWEGGLVRPAGDRAAGAGAGLTPDPRQVGTAAEDVATITGAGFT